MARIQTLGLARGPLEIGQVSQPADAPLPGGRGSVEFLTSLFPCFFTSLLPNSRRLLLMMPDFPFLMSFLAAYFASASRFSHKGLQRKYDI